MVHIETFHAKSYVRRLIFNLLMFIYGNIYRNLGLIEVYKNKIAYPERSEPWIWIVLRIDHTGFFSMLWTRKESS